MTAMGIPTPMPTLAPVLIPPSEEGAGVEELVAADSVDVVDVVELVLEAVGVALVEDEVVDVELSSSSSEPPRVMLK
jgi:hypothetical protein